MKLADRHNAAALAFLALGGRIVIALIIDAPELLNAGWISALTACVFSVPLALCLDYIEHTRNANGAQLMQNAWGRVYCAITSIFMLYEAGSGISLMSSSAGYIALESSITPLLAVIGVVVVALACSVGGHAIAGAASVGVRLFALAMVVVVLSQLNSYNMRWLTPVLGPGVPTLARSSLGLGGMLTGLVPIWLLVAPKRDANKRLYMVKVLLAVLILVTVLMLLYAMLLPSTPSGTITRWYQLERLLDNGRVNQALPVIMVPLWYGFMLIWVTFAMLGGIHTFSLALPKVNPLWVNIAFAAAALAITRVNLNTRAIIQLVNVIRWPVCTVPIFVYTLVCAIKKKRGAKL